MNYLDSANHLLKTVEQCVSPFHVVRHSIEQLEEHGFKKLELKDKWNVRCNEKYFVSIYDSSIVAFTIGKNMSDRNNIRIATAHNDFPCLRIKPECEIKESDYLKLNVEVYGGAILNTWLDRPLSIAGKVVVKSEDIYTPGVALVNIDRPVLTIPNLAPHINREINKGYEYNKQKDMLPIIDVLEEDINEQGYLLGIIAKELGIQPEDILDMELVVYQYEKGCVLGYENSMISCPRLDNLTSVEACLYGMLHGHREEGINMIAMFDNEEIGSKSKQGAASTILNVILEKIYLSLGIDREKYLCDLAGGIILSSDVSHCLHPNYVEKNDITIKAILNKGVVIKKDSAQKYANDSEGIAIVKALCEAAGVDCQMFVNRSDGTGGSTLGSIISTMVPMRTVDIGVPLLAMHSARELMGVKDQYALNELIKAFFS